MTYKNAFGRSRRLPGFCLRAIVPIGRGRFSPQHASTFVALLLLTSTAAVPSLWAQGNSGTVVGTIQDASGASVPDAEVSATGVQNRGGLTVRSDGAGYYTIASVPVGTYTITVTKQGFTTTRQEGVEVRVGTQVSVSVKLDVATSSTAVSVTESLVSLDTTSSRTSTTIDNKDFESLAKGRTFNSILALAPGVRNEVKSGTAGVGGIQVDGSSGLENSYYLDGIQSSDPISGALRPQNAVPLDFIRQLDVHTGGFEAEYGGATGGVVTAVIRSGANDFHGLVQFEGTGSSMNAGDRGYWQRSPSNSNAADFFRPKRDNYSILYPEAYLSGPILRNRLFFFGGYNQEIENTTRTINYSAGPRTYTQYRLRNYQVGTLDWAATSRLRVYGSYLYSPFRREGSLPNRDPRVAAPTNDLSIQGGYVPSQTVSTHVSYSITPNLVFDGYYGYKYLNDKDGNYGISPQPYVQYQSAASQSFIPVPSSLNFGSGFNNVTTTLATARDQTSRHQVRGDLSYTTTLFGQQHNFKGGYSFERIGENKFQDYSNGNFQVFWGQRFSRAQVTNATGAYGYYIWQDGVRIDSNVNGRNQGFYLQDNWRIHPRVTINAGIRLENEYLPPYRTTYRGVPVDRPISFGWGDKIVPRLGVAWDVTGDGTWKVSGSFGYFTDIIKYGLAQGSFGGQQWISHVYQLNSPNVLNLSRANPGLLGPEITSYDNRTIDVVDGKWNGVDPEIKPFRSRDINFAVDHRIGSRLTASLRYTRKDIIRAIEDIGVLDADGNEQYIIGNPGFGATRNTGSVYGQKTPNGNFLVPKATRQYDGVEFRVQGQIKGFFIVPSYTWSRLYGNYSGLGNSDEAGRSDPNNNRSFDLPFYYFDQSGSQRNVLGLLGTDRTHSFKLYSSYTVNSRAGATTISVNQLAYSGTPDSTSYIYLSAPTYPYGRGDLHRTPAYLQTDLALFHDFKFTERFALRLSANIQNLWNQGVVIARVSQLNWSGAIPDSALPVNSFFAGYDVRRFVFPGNTDAPYNPIYGRPGAAVANGGGPNPTVGNSSAFAATNPNFGAYQDGRVFRLGLRFTF